MTVTTRLSSKGQVVIPARVRHALGWRPGEKLSVEVPAGERALIIRGQTPNEVEAVLERGYEWLERNKHDLVSSLHESRRRARARERRRR